MFGKRKAIPPREVEIVRDRGEFRPGLYDRDMRELRSALGTLGRKMDAVLTNQVKLDELMRKVGLVTERDARSVEEALEAVVGLKEATGRLIANVDALIRIVEGVKDRVRDEIRGALDEAVNQIVASQQDVVGWLRRVADKAEPGGRGKAEHVRGGKDGAASTDEGQRFSMAEKEVAAELRQVIPMIVAGETARAVEALSAIYGRLDPASGEKPHEAPAAGNENRKRAVGLRSSWQAAKGESDRTGEPQIKSSAGQKENLVVGERTAASPEGEGGSS